ncbi:arsenite efflux transporter metallochaperone ArsD [Ilyobacter sp.]|uniref:arsenite efflux transporter metallochaperone ArsD n=1 Tax=Ilyobacter sp. TaxID=3100343 RepID=UPI00356A5A34
MKKMQIFESAMCCSTGICGASIDSELLRISTVLSTLKKNGVEINRFNLSSSPQEFVDNKIVNEFINNTGVDNLPITLLNDEIVISGRYPSNEELVKLLEIKSDLLEQEQKKSGNCCCSNGNC